MNKKFNILIAFLLLFLMAVFAYLTLYRVEKNRQKVVVAPKDNQEKFEQLASDPDNQEMTTDNWETYRNDDYKFEMKYPPEWEMKEIDEKTKKNFSFEKDTSRTVKVVLVKNYGDLAVTKKQTSLVVQFTDWYDITKDYYGEGGPKDIPVTTVQIGGRTAIIPYHKIDDEIPTDYEIYQAGCGGNFIMTLKPAPKEWGEFNTIIVTAQCEDKLVMKEILGSIKFL